MFVIGGENLEAPPEALDISMGGEGRVCEDIPMQNEMRYAGIAMLSSESYPIVCGNYLIGPTRTCEKYDPVLRTWTLLENEMIQGRSYSSATLVNDDSEYWITGELEL